MTILCLDVGDRRIGLAVSDPGNLIAIPIGALHRTRLDRDISGVLQRAEERDVDELVVGIPISLDGRLGHQARKVGAFVEALRKRTSMPVHGVDERFSTAEAERLLQQAGIQPSRDREKVDAAAAAVILQEYLDGLRAGSPALPEVEERVIILTGYKSDKNRGKPETTTKKRRRNGTS